MGNSKFPIDAAQIVGLFMESIFYGIYLITFFACIRVLLWTDGHLKSKSAINSPMVLAALLMFLFGTMDVAFGLRHNLDAFVYFGGNPIEEFERTTYWVNVMKMVDFVAQTFVGDSILLYRCWIVYERNWIIVAFPVLMWIAETVCGVVTIYIEATLRTNALLNEAQLVPFITSMLTLTLVTNVLTTSLIVHRIWSVQSSVKHQTTSSPQVSHAKRILIESGLLYTFSILVLFGTYVASNNAQFGVSDSVVQIIGITFNLIITSVSDRHAAPPSMPTFLSRRGSNSIPLHAISIQTTISRYPPDPDGDTPDEADIEKRDEIKQDW